MFSGRLLKNTHRSRVSPDCTHPSPCQARGGLVAAYVVGDAYMRPLQGIACLIWQVKSAAGALHLPACAKPRLAGRRQGHF
jgi:hypothetical protein